MAVGNSDIVYDGRPRLFRDSDFQAKLQAHLQKLRATIEARHVAELASAGWLRRQRLRWRMAAEYRRERRRLVPSDASLYGQSQH